MRVLVWLPLFVSLLCDCFLPVTNVPMWGHGKTLVVYLGKCYCIMFEYITFPWQEAELLFVFGQNSMSARTRLAKMEIRMYANYKDIPTRSSHVYIKLTILYCTILHYNWSAQNFIQEIHGHAERWEERTVKRILVLEPASPPPSQSLFISRQSVR